jgi:hypothetical protein
VDQVLNEFDIVAEICKKLFSTTPLIGCFVMKKVVMVTFAIRGNGIPHIPDDVYSFMAIQ